MCVITRLCCICIDKFVKFHKVFDKFASFVVGCVVIRVFVCVIRRKLYMYVWCSSQVFNQWCRCWLNFIKIHAVVGLVSEVCMV